MTIPIKGKSSRGKERAAPAADYRFQDAVSEPAGQGGDGEAESSAGG
jgi:hypothetical protein